MRGESIRKLLPVPFPGQSQLRLQDYAKRSADLPPVVATHKDGTQIAADFIVDPLPAEDGLVVMLRTRPRK